MVSRMLWGGKIKIAVLFARLGPYHHARLRAVGRLCDLTAIEFSAIDDTYAWAPVYGAEGFRRITLFADNGLGEGSPKETQVALWQALDSCEPTVVAVPGWASSLALLAIAWCRLHNIPAILMSDSQAIDETRVWWKELVKARVVRQCHVGFVAGSRHRDYLKMLNFSLNKIVTGYDVVDNEHFLKGAESAWRNRKKIRLRFELPEKYFLSIARLVKKKNLPRLIEAYAKYREHTGISAWHLVIVGDGPLRPKLEKSIIGLGLAKQVHLPGFKQYEELPNYYGLANAYVQASTTEQWGLVVNEAMASSLPVLVSNRCGCVDDLVHEGVNGYTFDPYDVPMLAKLMTKISAPDSKFACMGQESSKIIANWTPETFAENLLKAAELALKHPSPKPSFIDRAILKGLIHL